jgi:predicted nuclease of predicted toxin-antitoxin system
MKFKIDENLPVEVVFALSDHGHDAISVVDQNLAGAVDSVVANVCRSEQRAVVTLDMDFADVRTYLPEEYSGLIVLRPRVHTISAIVRLTMQLVRLFESLSPVGQLWILDEFHVRIRPKS